MTTTISIKEKPLLRENSFFLISQPHFINVKRFDFLHCFSIDNIDVWSIVVDVLKLKNIANLIVFDKYKAIPSIWNILFYKQIKEKDN